MAVNPGNPRWWQRLIPRYGNWGCPGWSAGRWNNDPALTDWSVPAVDAMDEAFKEHDWLYQHGCDWVEADKWLISRLRMITVSGLRARLYRIGAIAVFTLHIFLIEWRECMRNVFWFAVGMFTVFAGIALAGEVPPLTPGELDPAAGAIWSILAGQGPWGVLLFGIVTLVWKFAKPYLDEWAAARKMSRLLAVVDMAVVSVRQTYVDAIKAASADGKLTEQEARDSRSLALDAAVAIGKTQGMDLVKEYGMDVLNWAIEYVVGKMGIENKALKAVAVPLAASLQPLIPELSPATPERTGAVSG